jgi:hypothetical protein
MELVVCTGFFLFSMARQQNFRALRHDLCYNHQQFCFNFFVLWNYLMSEKLCPETSPWGWKALIITCILSFIFMVVFYLAMNNEPDYMPMNKNKVAPQSEMSQSSMMSETSMENHQHNH